MEKGHRVKVTIRLKGREMAHPERGKEVLLRFKDAVSDIADVEKMPTLDGRFMIMMLMPKKEK